MVARVRKRTRKRKLKCSVKIFLGIIFIVGLVISFGVYRNYFDENHEEISVDKEEKLQKNKELVEVEADMDEVVYKEGFSYSALSSSIRDRITGISFPKEFSGEYHSISYDDLVYVRLKYYDFDGKEHEDGEMIVNRKVADDVVEIFYELYLQKYPIHSIKLVEEYDGIDEKTMADNNSSAFNYRIVEDSDKISWHAFGLAIDINPLYNPYVLGNNLYPSNASMYVDRSKNFDGKIDHDDFAYQVFSKYGWKWGGDFINSKDYQHFYKEGIYDNSIRERLSS